MAEYAYPDVLVHDLEITMAMGRARRIVYAGITMSKMCSHD